MACPACREEFELLRALDRAGGEDVKHAVEGIRWKRNLSMAVAASAILAIGIGTGRQVLDGDRTDVMRGGGGGITLIAPSPSTAVSEAAPVTFAWRSMSGAQRYTVEVLTPEGDLAFEETTTDTTLTVSVRLTPGEYRWWVSAQSGDGSPARSEPRLLRVRSR